MQECRACSVAAPTAPKRGSRPAGSPIPNPQWGPDNPNLEPKGFGEKHRGRDLYLLSLQGRQLPDKNCQQTRWCSPHKWRVPSTQEQVAAKLVDNPSSVRREKEALRLANAAKVTRVVQLLDDFPEPTKGHWLILELLDGVPLSTYFKWRARHRKLDDAAEARMVAAAAALIETLYELHHDAKIAHLDLSSANIMLVSEAASDWLKLRILDFGLAEAFLPAGPCKNAVYVPGSTLPYAAPEVLQSMCVKRLHRRLIDGAAADMWAAGAVLFCMLTESYPFPVRGRNLSARAKKSRSAARRAQDSWLIALFCSQVETCHVADYNKTAVNHPLLDKVRAFSSTPDAAASFFAAIMHPSPTKRLTSIQALQHPYLRRCVQQMQASYSASQQSKLGAALVTPVSPPLDDHAHTHNSFLSKLMSAPSSGVKTLTSWVGRALPGNNSSSKARMLDPARYFPDYVHASSDAELSAHLPQLHTTGESQADNVGQLLAGINQVRTDFSLTAAFADPPTAIPAAILQASPPIKHVTTSADTDPAAAALQLQRQLYPASPLSAATPQRLPHDEQLQAGSEERTDSQNAGSGLIPAIHSAHAQPANPTEGLSDAASGKQRSETLAHLAAADRHTPLDDDPQSDYQPGSIMASHSKQPLKQAQLPSADQHAPAGSDGSAQSPSWQ
ncbi:Immunoglobulin [Trebouxia sp. C0009 RCD-2024]